MNKTEKILYWVGTLILVFTVGVGGIPLLMHVPQNVEGIHHLGYPDYFITILGASKVLGIIGILQPKWRTLKEWAYAGFAFDLLAASASHAFMGDEWWHVVMPLVIFAILLASHRQWQNSVKS